MRRRAIMSRHSPDSTSRARAWRTSRVICSLSACSGRGLSITRNRRACNGPRTIIEAGFEPGAMNALTEARSVRMVFGTRPVGMMMPRRRHPDS